MPTGGATESADELGKSDRSGRFVAGGSYADVGFAGTLGGSFNFGAGAAGEGGTKYDSGVNATGGSKIAKDKNT